jgi:PAS domain S-box-containing protein
MIDERLILAVARDLGNVELRLLGGFAAFVKGRSVSLKTRKDRALLAYLALDPRRHSRERLATLLWGDVEGDARHCLRQSLSGLARALRAPNILRVSRDDIGLDATAVTVDALRARSLLQSEARADLEKGIALYAGALLEGLGRVTPAFDDWLTVEREQLAADNVAAHRRLLDLHAAAGTPERAIAAASRLVEMEPFREEARRELMLLYAECGHARAAIAQYEAYAALLQAELGAAPEEATREVYRLLLDGRTPGRAQTRKPMPARLRATSRSGDEFLQGSVLVLEQMPDCVVVTDLDGRIVGWNQWAKRNFGYDKREVLGRKPYFLYGPHGGASVTAELIGKAVRYGRWSGVLRLFNKDGSSRLHKRTMMPLRDENGRIVGVFGVTRPLTRPIPGL